MAAPVADVQQLLERSLKDLHAPSDLAQRVIACGERARRRRRLSTGVGAVVLTAAAVVAAWATLDTSPEARPVTVVPATPEPASGELIPEAQRKPAPELAGTTIEGKPFAANFAKQPIANQPAALTVVNFCGSWSAPCRAEAPALTPTVHLGHAPSRLDGVTSYVGVDERDTLENARSYARSLAISYPIVFDGDGALGRAWHPRARGVPVTFVVDGDGLIAARFDGAVTRSELARVIDALELEARGGSYPKGEFTSGLHSAAVRGRTLTIAWGNGRCGDDTVLAELPVEVRVRENVRAVHVEMITRLNPADLAQQKAHHINGCLGVGVISRSSVTLAAPLGNRVLLDGTTGVPLPVRTTGP